MNQIPHPGYTQFLATFPQTLQDYGTGGNCTAWQFDLYRGATRVGEVLVTAGTSGCQPDPADDMVCVSTYDAHGNWEQEAYPDASGPMTWIEAIEFLQRRIAEAAQS